MNKKKILLLLIPFILVCIVISFIVLNERNVGIKMEQDIKFLEHISEMKITKLKLRQAVDLPEYVEFSDDDLIEEVISFLKTIKIKSLLKHSNDTNGGGEVLTMYFTDSENTIIEFGVNSIYLNGTNYLAEYSNTYILNMVFQKSANRGYLKKNN